jgi:tRNA nucleotidyltransferase (CCA-adding enzyme)
MQMVRIKVSKPVRRILERLNQSGFEGYAVGGCVRDSLLGREPKDWDICTSALPEEIISCFPDCRVHTVGIQHGTVLLIWEEQGYEITTYRTDGIYSDHRHPDGVTFVRSLEEDLRRRDFTINAMACDGEGNVIDLFHGAEDLKAGIIRCVGVPEKRFDEDSLRILRGLRFAARFQFQIEPKTEQAMQKQAPLLQHIAGERIFAELKELLAAPGAQEILLTEQEIFGVIMPELVPMFHHPQYNPHHCYNVWEHTCHAVGFVTGNSLLALTMLLHDSGKPRCFTRDSNGIGHFHGHPEQSADIAQGILNRFHCDNKTRDTILNLIRWHDRMRVCTRKSVRRMLAALGEEQGRLLFQVMEADMRAQSPDLLPQKLEVLEKGKALFEELVQERACVSIRELAVKGQDLIALGCPAGPEVGKLLNKLLEAVMEDTVANERSALLGYAAELSRSACKTDDTKEN